MSKNLMETIANQYVVKVSKVRADDRVSLCGSKFVNPRDKDHDGTEIDGKKVAYAIIPVHQVDYLKQQFKGYQFGEPFIPKTAEAEPVKK